MFDYADSDWGAGSKSGGGGAYVGNDGLFGLYTVVTIEYKGFGRVLLLHFYAAIAVGFLGVYDCFGKNEKEFPLGWEYCEVDYAIRGVLFNCVCLLLAERLICNSKI